MASSQDKNSDSDDEEFDSKMNVYLNSSRTSFSQAALEGILKRSPSLNKIVKFDIDEEACHLVKLTILKGDQEQMSPFVQRTSQKDWANRTLLYPL